MGITPLSRGQTFHYSTYLPSYAKQFLPSSQPTWRCQGPCVHSTDHVDSCTYGGSLSHPKYGLDKELDHYHTNYCHRYWSEASASCSSSAQWPLQQCPVVLKSRPAERQHQNCPKEGTSQATSDTLEWSTGWAGDYPSSTAYFPSLWQC